MAADEDHLRDLLLGIAVDAFPDLFRIDDELRFFVPGSASLSTRGVYAHENGERFADAIKEDSDLAVFAAPDGAFISTNQGTGWRVQSSTLAGSLVTSAALSVIGKGLPIDDASVFEAEVRTTYEAFRRLVRGEAAETLVLIGYDGLTLRDGVRLGLPWGSLRPASPLESVTSPFGWAPTCVLEVPVELQFRIGEPDDEEAWIEHSQAEARARMLLGIGAILGIERDSLVSPAPVWTTSIFPAMAGRGFSGTARSVSAFHAASRTPRGGGEPLSEEEESAFVRWADIVEEHYDPAIDVALRRTTLALLERTDASDSLIDAVIALENLFGHGGTTEVIFRVTAAAAHLLEPDPAKRAAFRRQLGDVYDVRSKVIHGAEIKPKHKLNERKEQAIKAAINALRVLFAEQPHLIPDRERGMRLILGTADP